MLTWTEERRITAGCHDPRAWFFVRHLLWFFYLKDISGSPSQTLLKNIFLLREEHHDQKFIFSRNSGFSFSFFPHVAGFQDILEVATTWPLNPVRSKSYRTQVARGPRGWRTFLAATSTSITPLSVLNFPSFLSRRPHRGPSGITAKRPLYLNPRASATE